MAASIPDSELTPAQVTITVDQWHRPVAVLPDRIAIRLAVSSRDSVRDYGYCHFESRRFDADTFETRAIRALLEAVVQAYPEAQGVSQYRTYDVGYFYGSIIGASGWDMAARTWKNYAATEHLRVRRGIHLHHDGRSHFGS
ncbi:hypothetical protein [Streptomyces rhizosphaericus]|uniref:Uncharacterized protein n=1 Tax=Streptomyces rhizosphaericus TaxID=114699 RepID=A0A6G4ASM6_9ACTN|nr:hypothetical protein [Streptomyces rhizosphaericus]NEW75467.1 hypothetical protein [Streptomyces rhizosphaericus]